MASVTIASLAIQGAGTRAAAHHGRRGWLRFAAHFVEMLVVMFLGMGVLTAVLGMPHDSSVAVQALYMTATMTVPMMGWMLFRGHSRRATAEMAVAMVMPLVALLPAQALGMLSADAILDLQHVMMIPAMFAAMLIRRTQYGL